MHKKTDPSVATPSSKHPAGFTLVEMLVSVTLVLMMMMMFAEAVSYTHLTLPTIYSV